MADIVVIYDPDLELGAVIDTDTMRACGPVGGGAQAKQELEQFVDAVPDVMFESTDSYTLARAWMEYWTANFQGLHADESGGAPLVVEPTPPGDDGAALAEHTASATAGEPPPPAPADTDMAASASEAPPVTREALEAPTTGSDNVVGDAPYTGPCFACGGTGQVVSGGDGTTAKCNLCDGSGVITAHLANTTTTTTEGTNL